jgi:hypothetical protein
LTADAIPAKPLILVFIILLSSAGYAQNAPATPPPRTDANELVREVIQNELKAQLSDQTYWRFRELTGKDGHKELRDVFETRDGDIYRTISIDGRPLTEEESQKERDRVSRLAAHPDEIRKGQKQREEDGKNERELLKMFPQAFRYRYDRTDGKLIELKFTPNPDFHPSKRHEQVFHHMEGKMSIDPRENRLVGIEGILTSEVKFGDGLLGHLDKGGTFSVRLQNTGSGHWDLLSLDVQLRGRALLFKSINLQQSERYTDYQRISGDMSLREAANLLNDKAVIQVKANSAAHR